MTLYLLQTWLLANLLHPLIVWIGLFLTGSALALKPEIGPVIAFMGVSSVFSFPALIFAGLGLNIIVAARQELYASLFVWIVTVAGSIIFEVSFIMLVLRCFKFEILGLVIPAIVAAAVAILIRHKQFSKLITTNEIN